MYACTSRTVKARMEPENCLDDAIGAATWSDQKSCKRPAFLRRVAPKEMHCSCTARKSNGDVRATPIMNRRGRKRRQPGSISRQRSPMSNSRAKVAIRFVDPARQLIPPNQKEAVVCHIGGFVLCKEVCRLGHETSRAVKRSGCDFGCSSRTGQVVQTIRCCRGHQV